jgi:hypothetical protein
MKSWKKWSLKVDAEQTCQGEPLPNPWLKPKYLYIAAFHSTLVSYKPRWHRGKTWEILHQICLVWGPLFDQVYSWPKSCTPKSQCLTLVETVV